MKKKLLIAFFILALALTSSAQPRAIGVRLGYDVEASYQHNFGSNFLEADLGFHGAGGFFLSGIYDFALASEGQFNFYAGPGAQLGVCSHVDTEGNKYSSMNMAIAGQVGAEYQFETVPIVFSLDWRPAFYLFHGGFGWESFALGVRFRF